MDIQTTTVGDINVVEIHGDLDGSTSPEAQARILPLGSRTAKILIDMSGVPYMSSAGLRMLLVIYRTIVGQGGKVVLVGLSADLQDTMASTGFMDFFEHFDERNAGLAALN